MDVKFVQAQHQGFVLVTVFILAFCLNLSLSQSSQCSWTSCYPAMGDLLIGRAERLHASSTCGLEKPMPYCVVSHLEEKNSCFMCDSRKPFNQDNRNSHTIDNVVAVFEQDWRQKWWQAENGVVNVYIQLDLEAEFHLTHLIMKFRTFRPAAMLIERSADFGRTWRVYRYFAKDCEESFPGISVEPIRNIGDVICESRYSDVAPSTGGEVIFRVLPATVSITDPYAKEVRDLMAITNLRVNFTALHTLGDNLLDNSPDANVNYYYAVYGIVLRGSCSCYGHASRCVPVSGYDHHPDMVHGKCECMHNTKGLNCEFCDDLFNDLPWRPARREKSNACQRCECNGHATACHFDPAIYEASGHVSGGVCDNCQHNTDGQHCHLCRPFFYQDPHLSLDDPYICKPCDCDPVGSLLGGECDAQMGRELGWVAGQCTCRRHVTGRRCDVCKHGYWNLDAENEDGCEPCNCNILGTLGGSTDCDLHIGQCRCKRYVTGKQCDRCQDGYWGFSRLNPGGCNSCDCDLGGAIDGHCGQADGQCFCRPNIGGISCTEPLASFYFPNLDHLLYEAELAKARGRAVVVLRKREDMADVTWTGPGFMRAFEGDIIEFLIGDIPLTLNYSIVVRYETTLPARWDNIRVSLVRPFLVDPHGRCGNIPSKLDSKPVGILPGTRHFISLTTSCLESGVPYTLRMKLSNYKHGRRDASVLIDSIALIPDVASVSTFTSSDRGQAVIEDFFQQRCVKYQLSVEHSLMPEHCLKHVRSASALIYNGAVACNCHPVGSTSDVCEPNGGQCSCKANVIGRSCDQCSSGSHSLGPSGCEACDCDVLGSHDVFCDVTTGQCNCMVNVIGQKCDRCQKGSYRFPECQLCQCNERADECDDVTGRCISCKLNTGGHNCERCADGYFGDPRTAEGCQPCLCPGGEGSGVQHVDSCHRDPYTRQVICNCRRGYTGRNCDQCEKNHFGQPLLVGGTCQKCECNENIDPDVGDSCDSVTGECTRCLYNTEGFNCERCQLGYYGDAVKRHNCKKCLCSILGSNRTSIHCDRVTGQCSCLPNVIGRKCDKCRPLYWKLASGWGCEPCDCSPTGSVFAQCNEFDGQCTCMSGRGGRDCSQCPNYYWGSPDAGIVCSPCDCNVIGSVDPLCDRRTGRCNCRSGVAGQKCDRCAPKTTGVIPNCLPCGECLDQWTLILQGVTYDWENVLHSGFDVILGEIPLVLDQDLRRIEEKLNETKVFVALKLVGPLNWNETRATIFSVRNNLTQSAVMVSATDSQLRGVLKRMDKARGQIGEVTQRNSHLKQKTKTLRDNATRISELDATGAYRSVRDSSFRSAQAENKVESAADMTLDTEVVGNQVDDIINEFQIQYDLQTAENEASLKRINDKFGSFNRNLTYINHAVCGGYGSPCDLICGGGGCGKCGGLVSCQDGSVTMAADAYDRTQRAEELLRSKTKTDDGVAAQVRDLEVSCMEAAAEGNFALSKAEDVKNSSERQRNNLQELLNSFTFFASEEKAMPSDIRQGAVETLQMEILLKPEEIYHLNRQIDKMLRGLKGVNEILKLTAADITNARNLQQMADKAKKEAENILKLTQAVRGNVNSAESAQNRTSLMLSELRGTVANLESSFPLLESETSFQGKVEELSGRLKNASSRLGALKTKRLDNRVKSDLAKSQTKELVRLNSRTRKKLKEVDGKYRRAVKQLDNRYNQAVVVKAKTAILLRRVTYLQEMFSNVTQLENSVSAKEREMARVMSELERLQSQMSDLLRDIRARL